MSENEITINSIEYVAKPSDDGCKGCAFEFDCYMDDTCRKCLCSSDERKDHRDVIFIEKPANETPN